MLKRFKLLFPYWEVKNIRLYYLMSALTSLWFIAGNWIFFWTKFMTFGQLGIMDASAFAFGLVMEVPSGAISDLIGKRKTIIWAMALATIGTMMMAFSNSMVMLWIAFFIAQLGWAFYSGAAEALAYDSLADINQKDGYDKVASTVGSLSSISSIFATLVGGALYVWWFRSTHLFWSFGYLISFILSFQLVEPILDTEKFSLSNYFSQLVSGTKQLFKPKLAPFIFVILALMGAGYLYEWGLIKPTMAQEFGFMAADQAIIFAAMSTIGAIAVSQIPRIRRYLSDKKGLYLLTIIMGIGFILAYFKLGIYGLIPMLLIGLTNSLSTPWVSAVVNDEIESRYRATALSTVALITKVPYTLLAILAGSMAQNGTFNIFNFGVGVVIITSVIIGIIILRLSSQKL